MDAELQDAITRTLQGRPPAWLPPHTPIYNRTGDMVGRTTGGIRGCRCGGGVRVGVRWADGTLTYPCTEGLEPGPTQDSYRIV
jgi:hypothetical protein